MERPKEGLWLNLIDSVPVPERDELLSLVGRNLVDTNETLWNEKNVLQEIVYEIHGKSSLSTPRTLSTNPGNFSPGRSLSSSSVFTTFIHSNTTNNKSSTSKSGSSIPILSLQSTPFPKDSSQPSKFQAKRLFKDALTFSHLHYNNDLVTELSTVSLSSFEYLDEIQLLLKQKQRHHLSELCMDLSLIQKYLLLENEKLQDTIQSLQGMIDQEVQIDDVVTTSSLSLPANGNTQSITKPLNSTSNSGTIMNITSSSSSSSAYSNPAKFSKKLPVKFSRIIKEGNEEKFQEALRIEDKKQDDEELLRFESMQKTFSNQDLNEKKNNNRLEKDELQSPRKSSRFRDKIKEAQSELFLVDDL